MIGTRSLFGARQAAVWTLRLLGLSSWMSVCGEAMAAPEVPSEVARDLLTRFASVESKTPSGRWMLSVVERRVEHVANETEEQTRKRLELSRASLAEGVFSFTASGWAKDLTVPNSRGQELPTRTRTTQIGPTLRVLVEATLEGKPSRIGRVTRAPTIAPADALLSNRVAYAASGIVWESITRSASNTTLRGRKLNEQHVLEFGGGEPPRLQRWELRRTLDGPDGAGQEQRYVCTLHQPSSAGAGGRLEEWVENPPPTGMVAQRVTVWKAAEGASPTAADLSFRFPKGTHVTDTREDTPVEYEQTEDGVDEEDVAQLARALQQGRVGVGAAAPDLQFEVPRKKPLRLSEHRGKVVVLFWFSPRTPYAESAGKFLFELSEAYRKKGVVFLGVAVDASGDGRGDEAQEFRKQAKWSFPVVTEAENEGLRRMGPVIAVPKIAVVDAVGVVAYVQAGITAEKIVEVLNRLTARAK